MMRIFIGYDERETVAYHVCAHSILSRATKPVSIVPLKKESLPFYVRKRDENQSTDFAYTRFLVPYICQFHGYALFMDCDMLVRTDINEILNYAEYSGSVSVVKHDYKPALSEKFLGQPQTAYAKKNWSSVMLFNNERCLALTPHYVNRATGMELHQFHWCGDDMVRSLPDTWNCLVGEENQCDPRDAKILHYTNGTPCFKSYSTGEPASWWYAEKTAMLSYEKQS